MGETLINNCQGQFNNKKTNIYPQLDNRIQFILK